MKKRIILFFIFIIVMALIPILIFPINASLEDAQFELGIELFRMGKHRDAVVELKRLLNDMKTRKYEDDCRFYIGSSYMSLGDYKSARAAFLTIIQGRPESDFHSRSLYMAGRAEYLMGNYTSAITRFDAYVQKYPSLDYADNSLYWKGEACLSLGRREEAKRYFRSVIERYPNGNKADGARFKLRLMELEEKAVRSAAVDVREPVITDESEELKALRMREQQYREQISDLNNEIDLLRMELTNLKEIGEGTSDEKQQQIEEKINALISWENILRVKEDALSRKEKLLNDELERLEQISSKVERTADE